MSPTTFAYTNFKLIMRNKGNNSNTHTHSGAYCYLLNATGSVLVRFHPVHIYLHTRRSLVRDKHDKKKRMRKRVKR